MTSGTSGTKEIRKDWPIEEGMTLGTTKISDRIASLVPDTCVLPSKESEGVYL